MTATVERIRKEASQLPFDEREALVRVLEFDLDSAPTSQDDPAEVEAEWDAVIKSRLEDIEAGTVRLVPLDEVEAEMDVFVASLGKA
ncbi:addiction module protein [Prosthecobacter sp.]|uniref:addiction module protein n=1 Tax=Prosthecobacter sp. TaxID=1965333 RepID=UPI00378345F3